MRPACQIVVMRAVQGLAAEWAVTGALMTSTDLIVTHHAQTRMQQRCVTRRIVDWVMRFGDRLRCRGGAWLFYLGRRAWQRVRDSGLSLAALAEFERAREVALVVAGPELVLVTVVRTGDIGRLRVRH